MSDKTSINKRKFGLIGYPLSHSFSAQYFKLKFSNENITDAEYLSYPIENLGHIFNLFEKGLLGLNVTIPYKEKVIPCLDGLDETAEKIGAVNTIKVSNGKIIGYNTDVYGFEKSITPYLVKKHSKNGLILGTGGASKAVAFVFDKLGYKVNFVSRTKGDYSYEDLNQEIVENHGVIVNCTPLGTAPKIEEFPNIPYQFLSAKHLLYDLIYNPEKTVFLKKAEAQGATIKNGHEMLVLQAEKSWSIWNDKTI